VTHRSYWIWQRILLPWTERRARSFEDPVDRLRYLRRTLGDRIPVAPGGTGGRARVWFALAAVVVAALAGAGRMGTSVRAKSPEVVIRPVDDAVLPAAANRDSGPIWLVETVNGQEVYSNGLRIETAMTVSNEARIPKAVDRATLRLVEGGAVAGIVYHTTESHMAPFDPANSGEMRSAGKYLLDYVRRGRCYNYVIDRFGRVHRVVAESDAAWHAGDSVWGDERSIYVDLNHTFLAVAFESQTQAGNVAPSTVTPAQVYAARALTAILRARHGIGEQNCVTHAQVSVNPASHLIGLHTDWAANFPFYEIGLPDNYGRAYASLTEFGFGYDEHFLRSTGTRMLTGLSVSEDKLRRDASARGLPLDAHRAGLRQAYRRIAAELLAAEEKRKESKK
jgi:hypothetical protein